VGCGRKAEFVEYWERRHHRARAVRDSLRSALIDGTWAEGAFPSDDELGRMFGVGRNVVREAVQLLVHEGVLQRRQGAGTSPGKPIVVFDADVLGALDDSIGPAAPLATPMTQLVLRWTDETATAPVAAALHIDTGDPVVVLERLDRSEDGPVIFWTTSLAASRGLTQPAPLGEPMPMGFYRWLENAGIELGSLYVRNGAVGADPAVAEVLDLEPGAAVMLMHLRLTSHDESIVAVSTGYVRSDRFVSEFVVKR